MAKKAKLQHSVLRPSELNTLFEETIRVPPKRNSLLNVGCLLVVLALILLSAVLAQMVYSAGRRASSQDHSSNLGGISPTDNLEIVHPYNTRSKRYVAGPIPFWLSLSCEAHDQMYKDLAYPKTTIRDQSTRFGIKAAISGKFKFYCVPNFWSVTFRGMYARIAR